MHTYRPGNLRDEIPRRRRLWPTPGCKAMEEEEDTIGLLCQRKRIFLLMITAMEATGFS
jgi:hypothetical protein